MSGYTAQKKTKQRLPWRQTGFAVKEEFKIIKPASVSGFILSGFACASPRLSELDMDTGRFYPLAAI